MKITRILLIFLSSMLILGAVLSFVSCGTPTLVECTEHKDENGDEICDTEGCGAAVPKAPQVSADAVNEKGELYLFKNGTPTFQFVLGTDALTMHKLTVDDLAELLVGLSNDGSEINVVAQGEGMQDVEILIGTVTNRGEEYIVNKYDYGHTGYVVKQIGTKIIVNGGSDDAIDSAIKYLKETVFGIKKNTNKFETLVMANDSNHEIKQSNYSLKEITVDNASIRDYVITYDNDESSAAASTLQQSLYEKCGIHLDIRNEKLVKDMPKIAIRNIENDGEGGGFYVSVDENNNFIFECEYAGKLHSLVTDFWKDNIFNKKNTYKIEKDFSYAPNLRDIYYSDFGARGDGLTDDFLAIKMAHDEANMYLLNVHADPDATYLIGHSNKNQSVIVKTNTYFHGCKFIFNDEGVEYNTSGRTTPIFKISPDSPSYSFSASSSPIKSLEKGATNIGWAPGTTVMIILYNNNVRHYIRYGLNENSGNSQHELIIVDKDGNVDPSTPIQWNYETITSMNVYNVDDRPIEIRGEGQNGERTVVTTWYNNGPSAYWYYARNFAISRSNVVLSGIEHVYDKYVLYKDGGGASPYTGFTNVSNCNNVIIENMIFECPPGYKDIEPVNRPSGSPNVNNGMGSYEISASLSNNITWRNCTQSNFFQPDGSVKYEGHMGTNYCKNLMFDNMQSCSFDAHCGVYNGTIKNSTVEHLNFIGDGLITLEDVTIYADANRAAINLRTDYGSTWAGELYIDGLIFKVEDSKNPTNLHLVKATWTNWNFGYTTYLPQKITVRNVLTAEYTYTLVGPGNGTNNRIESDKYVYNQLQVRPFSKSINESATDLGAEMIGISENKNRMVATKEIWFYTEYTGKYAELGLGPLKVKEPTGPFFKHTKFYINDVLQE